MRIETAERKALAEMQKKVEKEEFKYSSEIEKLETASLSAISDEEKEKYQHRISELQMLLAEVERKKEEIATLQNGKAGTVYIISNLGSFGENVFKIGMTRRIVPQERIDELSCASVPFQFDVHSFIFSEDAPALETKLHNLLDKNRVNKVNRRKEFFQITIDKLQKLVYEIDPTASFTTTMAAEEYRQSLSTDRVYSSTQTNFDDED
ncbi:MAG: GIY-YIG nuclease family protein [Ruminococcaceae bacterium]|nr:GIY-YIG nuclease family protein [Oscillospiraceae bacterium]